MSAYEHTYSAARAAQPDDGPRQAAMRAARQQMLAGAGIFLLGVALTVTLRFVFFWGAIVFGPIRAFRGASLYLRLAALPKGSPVPLRLRRRR